MKFRLPKRCPYCAHKLDENWQCVNKDCIAYVAPTDGAGETTTTTTTTTTSDKKGVSK